MKSNKRFLMLILPALVIAGLHHAHAEAAASVHQNHQLHGGDFNHAHSHEVGLAHFNHAHGLTPLLGSHLLHAVHANSRGKTWQQAQWWDEQARHDMRSRIARNGSSWTPQNDSFGKQSNWLPGWELRWWSFRSNDGGVVWVYHARSKTSGQRYTSFTNHADGKLQGWELAR